MTVYIYIYIYIHKHELLMHYISILYTHAGEWILTSTTSAAK